MAFHFNWSPLIADTDRVRQMLTSSLNKSPKPPIIVDDIIVNKLNLGKDPPSLEILEVGDLAEDRFRGIFKVRYEGDAYLTLKTRVQANPLNTFLSTKSSFASPNPLAAASGLTIPLQITLSDIRLSGFAILVFSKQKGITLVFRNDPLESLKVSSTFDSIPFVRDYLQKTIEGQLRVLFMEDLPAIIHRLSLTVFNDEYHGSAKERLEESEQETQHPIDPFASPAQNPVDSNGLPVGSPFSLDTLGDTYASFSQKNMVRLAALSESQRTLSLFTPGMRDTVYRAWATSANHNDGNNPSSIRPATLSRLQSTEMAPNVGAWSSAASSVSDAPSQATRPSLLSRPSLTSTYSLQSGVPRSRTTRKRKNRVVNLRRNTGDGHPDTVSVSSGYAESTSRSESASAKGSSIPASHEVSTVPTSTSPTSVRPRERDGEVHTPESSPKKKSVGFQRAHELLDDAVAGAQNSTIRARPSTPRHKSILVTEDNDPTPRASMYLPEKPEKLDANVDHHHLPKMQMLSDRSKQSAPNLPRSASELSISDLVSAFPMQGGSTGGILEQAWMMKMASEIAKRVAQEKEKHAGWPPEPSPNRTSEEQARWRPSVSDGEDLPPPAYVS